MLILRRKKDQKIRVGLDVTITVVDVKKDGSVVLGFEAPQYIGIYREEIYEKVRTDRRQVLEAEKAKSENNSCSDK